MSCGICCFNVQSQENVTLPNEENSTTDAYSEQNNIFPTWKPESRLEFLNCIQESNLDQINIDLDKLNLSESLNVDSINSINAKISQVLVDAAENCNMIKKKNTVFVSQQNKLNNQKPWFNKQVN